MTTVSAGGTVPRPRSRLRARIALAGLSACGLAALAWASFVQPLPRLIYNPSDSVAVGWYRVDPQGRGAASLPRPLSVDSIVLTTLPPDAAALAAQRGYLPARVPLLKRAVLEGRADDTEEAIRTRMEVYEASTAPLLDFYRQRGLVVTIDGEQSIDEVYEELTQKIASFTNE